MIIGKHNVKNLGYTVNKSDDEGPNEEQLNKTKGTGKQERWEEDFCPTK